MHACMSALLRMQPWSHILYMRPGLQKSTVHVHIGTKIHIHFIVHNIIEVMSVGHFECIITIITQQYTL